MCLGCGTVTKGIVGLTKAAAQSAGIAVDKAPRGVVQARRDVCRECPEATRNEAKISTPTKGLTTLSRCKKCNCFIAAKTKLASQSCPMDKWPLLPSE